MLSDVISTSRRDWPARLLDHAGVPAFSMAAVLVWLPAGFGLMPFSAPVVLIPVAAAAALFCLAEPEENRVRWLGVLGLALAVRLLVLVAAVYLGTQSGLRMLGPDGDLFFRASQLMNRQPWHWPSPALFGNTDIAHYYLFSAALRFAGDNLFVLRLLNTGLDALMAACAYSVFSMVLPRRAALGGLLVAVHSPLVVVATLDLWKDPSAVLAILVSVWVVLKAGRVTRPRDVVLLAIVGGVAFAYLRCTRSYWAFYLETAALGTIALMLIRRVDWRPFRRALTTGAAVVIVGEAVPGLFGWPPSPLIFLSQVAHVGSTEQMRARPTGAMDRPFPPTGAVDRPFPPTGAVDRPFPPTGAVDRPFPPTGAMDTIFPAGNAGAVGESDVAPRPVDAGPPAPRAAAVTLGLTIFRKSWGPYIWIAPPSFRARDVLRGDYLLFPGTAVWYFLMPSIALALLTTMLTAMRGRPSSWALFGLALYVATCLGHYFALNLSFRQRDGLFPLMVAFGLIGWDQGRRHRWWRPLHIVYFAILTSLAVGHLSYRSGVF